MQNNIASTPYSQTPAIPTPAAPTTTTSQQNKGSRLRSRQPAEIIVDADGRRFRNGVELFYESESESESESERGDDTRRENTQQPGEAESGISQPSLQSKEIANIKSIESRCGWLRSAVVKGDIETVKQLINENPDIIKQADQLGASVICQAIAAKQPEIAEILVNGGALVNGHDDSGKCALALAAIRNYLPLAKALIKKGAAVGQTDKTGGHPLSFAAYCGRMEIAQLLIESNANIDQADNDGRTPLVYAACNGRTKIAQLLINNKAQIDQADKIGRTPLMFAAKKGQTKTAQLLIKSGARIDQADNIGWTPLMFAAKKGRTETAQLLLNSEAPIDQADKIGWTPLMIAAKYNHNAIAKILLDCGAKIDQQNHDQDTALKIACDRSHTEISNLIMDMTDNPNTLIERINDAVNKNNLRALKHLCKKSKASLPLHIAWMKFWTKNPAETAIKKGNAAALKALLETGIRPNLSSENVWENLMKAANNGNVELLSVITNEFSSSLPLVSPPWLNRAASQNYLRAQESLTHAVLEDRQEIARLLLKIGAKADFAIQNEPTAIHVAIQFGKLQMLQLLLASDVKLTKKNPDDKASTELLLAIGSESPDPLLIDALLDYENSRALKNGSFSFALNFDQIFEKLHANALAFLSGEGKDKSLQIAIPMMLCTKFGLSYLVANTLARDLKKIIEHQSASHAKNSSQYDSSWRMAFIDCVATNPLFHELKMNNLESAEKIYASYARAPELAKKLGLIARRQADLLIAVAQSAEDDLRIPLKAFFDKLTSSTTPQQVSQFMQQAGWHPMVTSLVVESWKNLGKSGTRDTLFTEIRARLATPEFAEKLDQLPTDNSRHLLQCQLSRFQEVMKG